MYFPTIELLRTILNYKPALRMESEHLTSRTVDLYKMVCRYFVRLGGAALRCAAPRYGEL